MKTQNQTLSFTNTEIAFKHYTNAQLKKSYRIFKLLGIELINDFGINLTQFALAMHLPITPIVKPIIFDVFCGGESLEETKKTIQILAERNVQVNLNYGVEAQHDTKGIAHTTNVNIASLAFAGENDAVKVISSKPSAFGIYELLEKKQKKEVFTPSEQVQFDDMLARMDLICKTAKDNKAKVYWDAEETWVQQAIDEIVDNLMEKYNTESVVVYNTFQMYVNDKLAFLEQSIDRAKEKGYQLGAKIVRGAYMEKERETAEKEGRPSPIHKNKAATDLDYDLAIALCIANYDMVSVCVASHNKESNLKAAQILLDKGLAKNHKHVWFSQLYGMGEHITFNLAANGYNATKYVPFGPVKEVIPYLIRRADENSSVDGQMGRELGMLKTEINRRGI
jgi:proline dehydrogenase